MDPDVLDSAVERSLIGDDGRSGATLERLLLADGSRVVVKRYDPAADLLMRILGDERGREVELFRRGVLDRLPPLVSHPILDGWFGDDGLGVLVMRDLGSSVLSWADTVSVPQAQLILGATAQLHAAFVGATLDGLTPLRDVLGLFGLPRLEPFAGEELVDLAVRGWGHWAEVAPGEVGEQVLALARDCTPLVRACERLPATLLHGDLATVNMALEPDRPGCLTLIDWGMATVGPAEMELGRLLAGCGHLFACSFDDLLEIHRDAAGEAYDELATGLGLLAGIVWLGWNKALDIVEHPDAGVRERERANLDWWLLQARRALESGVL